MEMTGEQRIPVDQATVWRGLNDPDVLKASVPGCESIEKVSDNEYKLTVLAAVGPVRARFKGSLRTTDLNPPNSYNLVFEGQGGVAGFASGDASVQLSPDGSDTLLKYAAKAKVGGKLAQIGSRMIDATARKMSEQFFDNFKQALAPGAAAAPATATTAPRAGVPTWVWAVGGLIIVLIIAFLLGR